MLHDKREGYIRIILVDKRYNHPGVKVVSPIHHYALSVLTGVCPVVKVVLWS